jgi:hypothetical protein
VRVGGAVLLPNDVTMTGAPAGDVQALAEGGSSLFAKRRGKGSALTNNGFLHIDLRRM